MARIEVPVGLTPEQKKARVDWLVSLSGRQTPKYEAAKRIGRTSGKQVRPSRLAKAIQNNQREIPVA